MKYLPLVWAAVMRKPTRAILTLLSVMLAFTLFGLTIGMNATFAKVQEEARDVKEPVQVVVRVDVVGWAAHHPDEGGELAVDLLLDGGEILHVGEELPAVVERDVDTQSQLGPLARLLDGGLGVGPVHQQAGAGHDAGVVSLEDALVDLGRQAEVVGVDDQVAGRRQPGRGPSSGQHARGGRSEAGDEEASSGHR